MSKTLMIVLAGAMLAAGPAAASVELATKSKCMTCHQVDKKLLGPAFKDIGAKYKTQKGADQVLASSILKGSKGKWGQIPMPPQSVKPADAQALAKWILTLK